MVPWFHGAALPQQQVADFTHVPEPFLLLLLEAMMYIRFDYVRYDER